MTTPLPTAPPCPACGKAPKAAYAFDCGTIFFCGDCGLQWAVDVVGQGQCQAVYKDIYAHYMSTTSIDLDTYRPYVDFFAALPRTQGLRILDVGCGNGAFLALCLQKGLDAHGIEIDEGLRRVLHPQAEPRVRFISAENMPTYDEPFDVITFWDSFEHIADAFGVLDGVRSLLKPSGRVFIHTNNSRDIYNFVTAAMLRAVPPVGRFMLKNCFNIPQHYWNFNMRAMELMLRRHGWTIVSSRQTDTPASRLTPNKALQAIFRLAYGVNALLGGGKIGEYTVAPAAGSRGA